MPLVGLENKNTQANIVLQNKELNVKNIEFLLVWLIKLGAKRGR